MEGLSAVQKSACAAFQDADMPDYQRTKVCGEVEHRAGKNLQDFVLSLLNGTTKRVTWKGGPNFGIRS